MKKLILLFAVLFISRSSYATIAPITGPGTVCASSLAFLSDASPGGTWSSANPFVASVNVSGTVVGVHGGTTTITYTIGSLYATHTVTVIPAPAINIASITGDTSCTGTPDILYAVTAGITPDSIAWYRSGIYLASGDTLIYLPSNGDSVYSVLTGTSQCTGNPVTITSNSILTTVAAPLTAGIITGPDSVCFTYYSYEIILTGSVMGGTWCSVNDYASVWNGMVWGIFPGIDTIYYVVTNKCGSDTASHIVIVGDSILSVKTLSSKINNITFYPNPATTQLTIQSTDQPINQLTITNLLGQTVRSLPAGQAGLQFAGGSKQLAVDISSLPSGVYFIKVNGSDLPAEPGMMKFIKN